MCFPWSDGGLPDFQINRWMSTPLVWCHQTVLVLRTTGKFPRNWKKWSMSEMKYTPKKLTWLAGKSTMNEDVFPIENGDVPASHVSFFVGVNYPCTTPQYFLVDLNHDELEATPSFTNIWDTIFGSLCSQASWPCKSKSIYPSFLQGPIADISQWRLGAKLRQCRGTLNFLGTLAYPRSQGKERSEGSESTRKTRGDLIFFRWENVGRCQY